MSSEGRKFIGALLAATLLALTAGCDNGHAPGDDHDHGAADEEAPKGPHGGRLLEDGDFALEVTMFERGVPPEFHIYPLRKGKPVDPAEVQLSMELSRLGGRVDRIAFQPQDDFLRSTQSIAEPHSWAVKATAQAGGQTHVWSYESFEGRTTIAPEMARGAGVETAVAGPGRIEEQLSLFGSIQPDPDRIRNVSARFPGVIRSVHVNVGDRVKQGQQLAAIESNESLQVYALTAPITGVIVERHANVGETTDGDALFQVADFSSVRADLMVFPRDRGRLRRGQPVRVTAADGAQEATASVDFIAPAGTGGNQALLVRVLLDNADGRWTPGQFVEGLITVSAIEAPLVIPRSALQTFRDWEVAFVKVGDVYEFRPLELGRTDGERVEVLGGLQAGDTYVSGNSYLIKADIEKSGASHDH
ncbi:MAG: efflux RND transporter periplasmic adaptor subunit [Gammaproteobacteria bacterium]|nr:efflux RND transporter periplasmic adaptor subunit [Gammaproteobacteria bacterium]